MSAIMQRSRQIGEFAQTNSQLATNDQIVNQRSLIPTLIDKENQLHYEEVKDDLEKNAR